MKTLLPLILLILAGTAFGQKADLAIPTYAEDNRLISITNLSGLSDCESKNLQGILKKVKVRTGVAHLRLKVNGEKQNIDLPLDRLARAERAIIFMDLVRTGLVLRIAGYACTPDAPVTAFSIDRIY